MFANYAFLIVIFFGIVGTINSHEPLSELTVKLILFIIPVVFVFTWYMNGGDNLVKVVLNRNTHNKNHNGNNSHKDG